MMGCLVFNHHSLPFEHKDQASVAILDFLKTCIEAQNVGLRTVLVDQTLDESLFRVELAPGYFWQDWYNLSLAEENREAARAFRSIVTKSPLFSIGDIDNGVDLFDVSLNDESGYTAVRAAAWHGAPLVSFETRAPWDTSPLLVKISQMNPETVEIEVTDSEIPNFYSHSVFSVYLPQLREQQNLLLSSGKAIVKYFGEFYPGVELCGKAPQQLNNWSASLTILNQIKKSLTALSGFSQSWQRGEVDDYTSQSLENFGLSFRVTGESETVRNKPALRKEREFWLPCGRQEFFEQHIKMSSGYRLHFYPDHATRQVYVGYVGPHLKLD